jgi:hypothetical protein
MDDTPSNSAIESIALEKKKESFVRGKEKIRRKREFKEIRKTLNLKV